MDPDEPSDRFVKINLDSTYLQHLKTSIAILIIKMWKTGPLYSRVGERHIY